MLQPPPRQARRSNRILDVDRFRGPKLQTTLLEPEPYRRGPVHWGRPYWNALPEPRASWTRPSAANTLSSQEVGLLLPWGATLIAEEAVGYQGGPLWVYLTGTAACDRLKRNNRVDLGLL